MIDLTNKIIGCLKEKDWMMTTAESCTGGLLAATLTESAGASAVFDRGFVVYSNEAKNEVIGVPDEDIRGYSAVSKEVAAAMVTGALKRSWADLAISITGIAGPTSDSDAHQKGLIYIAVGQSGKTPETHQFSFEGDRSSVRKQSVKKALELAMEHLEKDG